LNFFTAFTVSNPTEVIFPGNAKNVPIGKNRRRGRPRNTESALNKQYDDNDYTESSASSNTEKSPDTNQMSNELGLGDSNTVDKTNESNDTANDQDNDINTSQVSESDLIDREGDIENYSDREKNQNLIESYEEMMKI